MKKGFTILSLERLKPYRARSCHTVGASSNASTVSKRHSTYARTKINKEDSDQFSRGKITVNLYVDLILWC